MAIVTATVAAIEESDQIRIGGSAALENIITSSQEHASVVITEVPAINNGAVSVPGET